MISARKSITYAELLRELYIALSLDTHLFTLKLEVAYACGAQSFPPIVIETDDAVSFFVEETSMDISRRTPLCVTPMHVLHRTDETLVDRDIPSCYDTLQGDGCRYNQPYNVDSCLPQTGNTQKALAGSQGHEALIDLHSDVQDIRDTLHRSNPYNEVSNERPLIDLNVDPHVVPDYGVCHLHNDKGQMHSFREEETRRRLVREGKRPMNSFKIPDFLKEGCLQSEPDEDMSCKIEDELYLGKSFDSKEDLKLTANLYAVKNNFHTMVSKSGTDVFYVVCKEKNRCKWRLRGRKMEDSKFKVVAFKNVHTCSLGVRKKNHPQATPAVVGHLIKHRFATVGPRYLPRHIGEEMKADYGIDMKYEKSWRCKEKAVEYVRGTPEDAYALLPSYLHMLVEKNPDTIHDLVTEENGEFKYCFFSLGASRKGFKTCRPVICVDGTALKSKHGGVLLVAVAKDANESSFPIACAIVDSENNDSWTYFMIHLRTAIGFVPDLVFVSDRHQSIANALDLVFHEAHHGACFHHIKQNLIAKFKNEDQWEDAFTSAAFAYRRSEFRLHFGKLQADHDKIAKFLENIGIKRWARSHFPVNRYNVMTSNDAESFNNVTRDARTWPVISTLEFIRFTIQDWFYKKSEKARVSTTILASKNEKKLKLSLDKGKHLITHGLNQFELQVIGSDSDCVVNLLERTCECGRFQAFGLPCEHAAAAALARKVGVYTLCSDFYTLDFYRQTYAETVYPCGNTKDWVVPEHVSGRRVSVPIPRATIGRPKKKQGRPKTKRILSQGEHNVIHRRCGRCGVPGHNRASCIKVL